MPRRLDDPLQGAKPAVIGVAFKVLLARREDVPQREEVCLRPSWQTQGAERRQPSISADELVADARIDERTYGELSAELDTQQLMDVVFTVGAYEVFAMAMRTFDVELDDDLRPYA